MSAQVFVHPRCFSGPSFETFANTLAAHGFSVANVAIGPADARGRRELVRKISAEGIISTFERMNGTRFTHRMGQITEAPEVA